MASKPKPKVPWPSVVKAKPLQFRKGNSNFKVTTEVMPATSVKTKPGSTLGAPPGWKVTTKMTQSQATAAVPEAAAMPRSAMVAVTLGGKPKVQMKLGFPHKAEQTLAKVRTAKQKAKAAGTVEMGSVTEASMAQSQKADVRIHQLRASPLWVRRIQPKQMSPVQKPQAKKRAKKLQVPRTKERVKELIRVVQETSQKRENRQKLPKVKMMPAKSQGKRVWTAGTSTLASASWPLLTETLSALVEAEEASKSTAWKERLSKAVRKVKWVLRSAKHARNRIHSDEKLVGALVTVRSVLKNAMRSLMVAASATRNSAPTLPASRKSASRSLATSRPPNPCAAMPCIGQVGPSSPVTPGPQVLNPVPGMLSVASAAPASAPALASTAPVHARVDVPAAAPAPAMVATKKEASSPQEPRSPPPGRSVRASPLPCQEWAPSLEEVRISPLPAAASESPRALQTRSSPLPDAVSAVPRAREDDASELEITRPSPLGRAATEPPRVPEAVEEEMEVPRGLQRRAIAVRWRARRRYDNANPGGHQAELELEEQLLLPKELRASPLARTPRVPANFRDVKSWLQEGREALRRVAAVAQRPNSTKAQLLEGKLISALNATKRAVRFVRRANRPSLRRKPPD
eukprot:TRINITY_DN12465_c0_g2_i2.p1 TRINITY_DN12465_c0_g2~~TRINITY_DN12465_c0_g2_i2.p1  ORF type:complete len:722 (+),score=124.87 TRINITY_DN12465_c0_g2_i2:276-2168(+)